eukprot:11171032-Lingulodinium_polyedra.AAC.1
MQIHRGDGERGYSNEAAQAALWSSATVRTMVSGLGWANDHESRGRRPIRTHLTSTRGRCMTRRAATLT